jgi:2-amino-4-hydroxy-6-hydroxymethyldihydropteridine diphosphokinase
VILIGLGANLPSAVGPPRATLAAALEALEAGGVRVLARSRWYHTAPVPASDQPWFINAVASVATPLDAVALLSLLHRIEARFGRTQHALNAARPLDLDLLDYDGLVRAGPGGPVLPHPRQHLRAFVLLPLAEIAPDWRHPGLGLSLDALIAALPSDQAALPLPDGAPRT